MISWGKTFDILTAASFRSSDIVRMGIAEEGSTRIGGGSHVELEVDVELLFSRWFRRKCLHGDCQFPSYSRQKHSIHS